MIAAALVLAGAAVVVSLAALAVAILVDRRLPSPAALPVGDIGRAMAEAESAREARAARRRELAELRRALAVQTAAAAPLPVTAAESLEQVRGLVSALDGVDLQVPSQAAQVLPLLGRLRDLADVALRDLQDVDATPAGSSSQASGAGAGGSVPLDPAAALVSSPAGVPVGSRVGDGVPPSPSPTRVQSDDLPAGEVSPGAAPPG